MSISFEPVSFSRMVRRRWMAASPHHGWLSPLIILLTVLFLYLLWPSTSNPVRRALLLSYPTRISPDYPNSMLYSKGPMDIIFIVYYTLFFTFTREFCMQQLLRPLARKVGILTKSRQARFMEQVYAATYFCIFGPLGLYVMSRTPIWYFSTAGMYQDFPHRELEGVYKTYYLLQASYWAQQMIVLLLMLEKPRKDFKELVAHHIITLSLIALSYIFHFTSMGVAIYITHDISDFFLATSKTLNYLQSSIVVPYFGCFVVTWAYLRHYINLRIIFSFVPYFTLGRHPHPLASNTTMPLMTANFPSFEDTIYLWPSQFSSIGPYTLNWRKQQYKSWISQIITFTLLASLQTVNLFWFYLILRVAWKLMKGGERVDERSEDEDENEDERGDWKNALDRDSSNRSPATVSEKQSHQHKQEHKQQPTTLSPNTHTSAVHQSDCEGHLTEHCVVPPQFDGQCEKVCETDYDHKRQQRKHDNMHDHTHERTRVDLDKDQNIDQDKDKDSNDSANFLRAQSRPKKVPHQNHHSHSKHSISPDFGQSSRRRRETTKS